MWIYHLTKDIFSYLNLDKCEPDAQTNQNDGDAISTVENA